MYLGVQSRGYEGVQWLGSYRRDQAGEDRITIYDDGFDTQPFEEANAIYGEISGALHGDASIGILSNVHDLYLTRAKVNGNQNRHQANTSLVENRYFGKIDRHRGGLDHER